MNDDIVTRLRNHVRGDFEKTSEFMLGLAADEIERLRAERNRWRATAEVLARELGKVEYADAEWLNQEGLH